MENFAMLSHQKLVDHIAEMLSNVDADTLMEEYRRAFPDRKVSCDSNCDLYKVTMFKDYPDDCDGSGWVGVE